MPGFGVSGGDRPEQRADDSASAAVVAPHGKSSIMEVADGEECMPTPIRWSACQMVANVDATLILLSFGSGTRDWDRYEPVRLAQLWALQPFQQLRA